MAKKSADQSSGSKAAQEVAKLAATGRKTQEGSGGSKASGKNRSFGYSRGIMSFSSVVVIILVLGVALVAFAYITRDASASPRQNEDHWHSAYGVWDCAGGEEGEGAFEPFFLSTNDNVGIHSHQDGVIHIHPWYERSSGHSATLEHFFLAMNAEVTEEAIRMPDGRRLSAGVECDGEPSIITVRRWRDINNLDRDPVIYDEDFDDIRFIETGEAFVFARAPKGADVPPPPEENIQNTYNVTEGLISRPPLDAETDADVETETDAETDADVEVDAGTDADVEVEADEDAGTEADIEIDAGTEADIEIDAGTEADVEVEADEDAGTEADIEIDAGTEADVEVDEDAETDAEVEVDEDAGEDAEVEVEEDAETEEN